MADNKPRDIDYDKVAKINQALSEARKEMGDIKNKVDSVYRTIQELSHEMFSMFNLSSVAGSATPAGPADENGQFMDKICSAIPEPITYQAFASHQMYDNTWTALIDFCIDGGRGAGEAIVLRYKFDSPEAALVLANAGIAVIKECDGDVDDIRFLRWLHVNQDERWWSTGVAKTQVSLGDAVELKI